MKRPYRVLVRIENKLTPEQQARLREIASEQGKQAMSKSFLTILVIVLVLPAASLPIASSPEASIIDSKGTDQTPRRNKEGSRMPEWIPSSASTPIGVSGGLIALTLRDQNGKLQIFTINADGTNKRQLTFEGDNGRADWSHDGKRIAFMSIMLWVAVIDADGSNQKLLVEGAAPDWSPDGKQIAYSRPVPPGSEFWVINADGTGERQITRSGTAKGGPSWSPDGKEMVFISSRNPGSPTDPQPEIGIMNSDGTNERILTAEDRINIRVEPDGDTTVCETANDANAPAWSPVDSRIAFWSGIENQYGQIWVINSVGMESKQLTEDCRHGKSDDPSWSPDGKKILFSTGRSGRNELWVMDADGSNEKRISDIDAFPFPGRASWQGQLSAPPSITTHPSDQTVSQGRPVTFNVAATGSTPLSYEWQRNTVNIAGANSPSYTISSTLFADNGATVRCVVSNTFGIATSNEATLTVTAPPGRRRAVRQISTDN